MYGLHWLYAMYTMHGDNNGDNSDNSDNNDGNNGDNIRGNGWQWMFPWESTDNGVVQWRNQSLLLVGCYPVQQCTMWWLLGSIILQDVTHPVGPTRGGPIGGSWDQIRLLCAFGGPPIYLQPCARRYTLHDRLILVLNLIFCWGSTQLILISIWRRRRLT